MSVLAGNFLGAQEFKECPWKGKSFPGFRSYHRVVNVCTFCMLYNAELIAIQKSME